MKLRKLTLSNVRRFADKTVSLGPFGDGLTTITEENERGKSTFFDALHALIFNDHGSAKKELRDLQPYSGGAIHISAEIELDTAPYRIEKVFNLKKAGSSATITCLATNTILKQSDNAEQWIHENILANNKGPVGLLWVRQGTIGVDPAKGEADGINARRDVMSSVRGQIDAVTGGRRMDAILQNCRIELDAICTKQGKPKAGSQWKEAEDQAEILREKKADLQRSVTALSHDLSMKKTVTKRLRDLSDPALQAQRLEQIKEKEELLTAARNHDRRIKEAGKDLQLLVNEEREIERNIQEITKLREKRQGLATAISEKEILVDKAGNAKIHAQETIDNHQASIKTKEVKRRSLNEELAKARQKERASLDRTRLIALCDQIERLKEPLQHLAQAETILQGPEVTKAHLEHLSELERRRDIAIEKRKIHFASFTLISDGQHANIEGKALPNGERLLIDKSMHITVPNFGAIHLSPAEGATLDIEDPSQLQSELEHSLRQLGQKNIKTARATYETRRKAQETKQLANAHIRTLAPDGIETLKRQQQELCQSLGCTLEECLSPPADTQQDINSSSQTIESAISAIDQELDLLRQKVPELQKKQSEAEGRLIEEDVLLRQLRAQQEEIRPKPEEETQYQSFLHTKSEKAQKVSAARNAYKSLTEQAPDLAAAEAAFKRAKQADEEDKKELHRHEKELARLNGAIQTQSEGAVEEKLAEVTGKLARLEERAGQFANHAKAIKMLIEHLDAARAQAQETYFEPIRNELLPLLRQLHAGADFQIDADKLLIDTITRNGVTDKVDVLSGGAFEQIAVLTRLAFARLFSKHGNHVPIILDDALVHTDDDRISAMFNMLAQIAKDQQIIVLSCRTRAFSDLGGARAFITDNSADIRNN